MAGDMAGNIIHGKVFKKTFFLYNKKRKEVDRVEKEQGMLV